ncbi:cornifelin homolog [Polypterus senegalus]|uniref:cornifelin homolog n=1 Tax=Polypterus senegalus TaxID=55291 RepID=UPI00196630A5|nr:cornifelin homolog [Polypterus senegalus]
MAVQPVVTFQPGTALAVVNQKPNKWNSGLFDCCEDMGICCCAFWCYPCFMCKTVSEYGECLCLPLLDYSGIHPISLAMRSSMRERFYIQGSICGDCCVVVCCNSCSWCQMARELKHQKRPLIITAQSVPPPMAPGLYPSVPH